MTLTSLHKIRIMVESEIDDELNVLSFSDPKDRNFYSLDELSNTLFNIYDDIIKKSKSNVSVECIKELKNEYVERINNIKSSTHYNTLDKSIS